MRTASLLLIALAGAAAACGSGDGGSGLGSGGSSASGSGGSSASGSGGSSASGSGGSSASGGSGGFNPGDGGGSGGSSGNDNCGSDLTGTLRDFHQDHPDFEYKIADDPGIVEAMLGTDKKPVYAHGMNPTVTVHSQQTFDQWYRDVSGVNMSKQITISLTAAGGNVYTYDNGAFFPIDNELFGNEGNNHNFHFTFELHTKFVYNGGEVFKFTGDDDLWTFINGHLAIDLGGVHGAETKQVDLDASASALGITKGGTYALEVFSAERHTSESHFRIDTTIASFVDCGGTIN